MGNCACCLNREKLNQSQDQDSLLIVNSKSLSKSTLQTLASNFSFVDHSINTTKISNCGNSTQRTTFRSMTEQSSRPSSTLDNPNNSKYPFEVSDYSPTYYKNDISHNNSKFQIQNVILEQNESSSLKSPDKSKDTERVEEFQSVDLNISLRSNSKSHNNLQNIQLIQQLQPKQINIENVSIDQSNQSDTQVKRKLSFNDSQSENVEEEKDSHFNLSSKIRSQKQDKDQEMIFILDGSSQQSSVGSIHRIHTDPVSYRQSNSKQGGGSSGNQGGSQSRSGSQYTETSILKKTNSRNLTLVGSQYSKTSDYQGESSPKSNFSQFKNQKLQFMNKQDLKASDDSSHPYLSQAFEDMRVSDRRQTLDDRQNLKGMKKPFDQQQQQADFEMFLDVEIDKYNSKPKESEITLPLNMNNQFETQSQYEQLDRTISTQKYDSSSNLNRDEGQFLVNQKFLTNQSQRQQESLNQNDQEQSIAKINIVGSSEKSKKFEISSLSLNMKASPYTSERREKQAEIETFQIQEESSYIDTENSEGFL